MRGKGKTNYLKNRLLNVFPLFIVDIRNEYSHIPAFRNHAQFLQFALKSVNGEVPAKLQARFAFSSVQEYVKLYYTFAALQNCTIVVDEADAIFQERKFAQPLTNVFLGSRNNGINMVFVAKRPFLLPILIRSQADEYVIFGIEEDRDINYLESKVRGEFPKPPQDLQQGEYILKRQGEKAELKRVGKFNAGLIAGRKETICA